MIRQASISFRIVVGLGALGLLSVGLVDANALWVWAGAPLLFGAVFQPRWLADILWVVCSLWVAIPVGVFITLWAFFALMTAMPRVV